MYKTYKGKSAKFEQELSIVGALRKRLAEGGGSTRITMKSDGQNIDIDFCYGGQYHVTFPPYYDACNGPYKALNRWFGGLDEVAVFLMNEGWKNYWNK